MTECSSSMPTPPAPYDEGVGYYHAATVNRCDESTGLGMADPTKNCVFAHNNPQPQNWATFEGKASGQLGNMAFNVEAYKEPFDTTFGATTDRLTIEADLNASCQNFNTGSETFHRGQFPDYKLHVDMKKDQFANYKETFEIANFPYYGNVSDPKHSVALVYFFSTSSRVSIGGGSGVSAGASRVGGPSVKFTPGLDCSASPKPAGCPFIRLDDEVDIYWQLEMDASGGNLSEPAKLGVTANIPEGDQNPFESISSDCDSKACPVNSTTDIAAAAASKGATLYCKPSQVCGARAVYFSFHPRGAKTIVWDPTVVGLAEVPAGGGNAYFGAATAPPAVSGAPPRSGFSLAWTVLASCASSAFVALAFF